MDFLKNRYKDIYFILIFEGKKTDIEKAYFFFKIYNFMSDISKI